MALFFDTEWWAAQLKEKNADKKQLAKALNLSLEQMESVWKDQRQLSDTQINQAAAFLGQPKKDVIHYAGIAIAAAAAVMPVQQDQLPKELPKELPMGVLERLDAIERQLAEIQNTLNITKKDST